MAAIWLRWNRSRGHPEHRRDREWGVSFHNMGAMPACSNGRAALFTDRYPFRTNVLTAIGNEDLANYMVNPNEITLPKLHKQRGYTSALFGKFHMGIQDNDPFGYAMVHALGFDFFAGWLDATSDPSSIDTTAGGVSPSGTWFMRFRPRCRRRRRGHGSVLRGGRRLPDNQQDRRGSSGPSVQGFRRHLRSESAVVPTRPRPISTFRPSADIMFRRWQSTMWMERSSRYR